MMTIQPVRQNTATRMTRRSLLGAAAAISAALVTKAIAAQPAAPEATAPASLSTDWIGGY